MRGWEVGIPLPDLKKINLPISCFVHPFSRFLRTDGTNLDVVLARASSILSELRASIFGGGHAHKLEFYYFNGKHLLLA